jgi:hypothetical protein
MKIILTSTAQNELNRINSLILNEELDYHDMSEAEQLLADAGMYIDEAYTENNFTNLDEWCSETACGEYETEDGDLVKQKINKMLELNIIQIID